MPKVRQDVSCRTAWFADADISLQMLTLNLASDTLVCRCWRLIWRRTVWFADADRCRTVYVADADAKFGVGQSMLQMLTLIFGVGQPMLQMLTLVFLTFWSTNTKKRSQCCRCWRLFLKPFGQQIRKKELRRWNIWDGSEYASFVKNRHSLKRLSRKKNIEFGPAKILDLVYKPCRNLIF